jgi:hypothetical protein
MAGSKERGIPSTTRSVSNQHLQVMHHLSYNPILRPWILGNFAIYAPSIHVARKVYGLIRHDAQEKPRGVATTDEGTTVNWINIGRATE